MIQFTESFVALDYEGLKYNPCDDLIFPSVVRVGDRVERALDDYYMYYAPHNAPGGICLAFADDLRGPWREVDGNPLIATVWEPHHHVSHISSPHAIWREDLQEIWLYYHGENTTTRWARSKDGISFTYGGEAIQTEMAESPSNLRQGFGSAGVPGASARLDMSGASYARVFDSPFADSPGRFLMVVLLFKYSKGSWERFEKFGLYPAWSDDGKEWSLVDDPIVSLEDFGHQAFVCSPFVYTIGDRVYLLFHLDEVTEAAVGRNLTAVCAMEIDRDLKPVGEPFTVCDRTFFGEGNQRFADPCMIEQDGEAFLFGAIGPRLNQRIGCAVGRVE